LSYTQRMLKGMLIGAAVVVGIVAVMAFFPDRSDPGDDDVLVTSAASLPAAENSYGDYLHLKAALQVPQDERSKIRTCASDAACDAKPFRAVLARNERALKLLEGMRGKRFLPPEWSDPSKLALDTVLPDVMTMADAGSLAVLRARDLRAQGRAAEALEASLRAAEAGHAWERSGSPLIAYMVGSSLKQRALRTAQQVLGGPGAPAADAKVSARLKALRDNREGLKHALRLEYTMSANLIARIRSDGYPDGAGANVPRWAARFFFKPNRSRASFAETFRGLLAAVDRDCPAVPAAEPEQRSLLRDSNFWTGNPVGAVLNAIAQPNFDRLPRRRCEEDFRIGAAELTLAAKAFARRHSRAPSGAAELAPKYLPELPRDPFTGQPLELSPKGEISTPGVDQQGQALAARVSF
jgi:hypothetical protein